MSTECTFAVVLVRPREEGNVGAAARAMANMGLSEMVLVEPAAPCGEIAHRFAVGATDILDRARRVTSLVDALAPYQRVVATTSLRGREAGVEVVTPQDLAERIARRDEAPSTALVFGPEVSGLTREELAHSSFAVRVPCALEQPTLNLSQAVLLVSWELRRADLIGGEDAPVRESDESPAAAGEIDGLFDQLLPVINDIGFARHDGFPAVIRDLRHLLARARPSQRDVRILRGIVRRADHALRRDTSEPQGEGRR